MKGLKVYRRKNNKYNKQRHVVAFGITQTPCPERHNFDAQELKQIDAQRKELQQEREKNEQQMREALGKVG